MHTNVAGVKGLALGDVALLARDGLLRVRVLVDSGGGFCGHGWVLVFLGGVAFSPDYLGGGAGHVVYSVHGD